MSRLTTSVRRVCTTLLLFLSFSSALVHAQYLKFRIDAPKGVDYDMLRQDVGSLKITFSSYKDFCKVSNYTKRGLDLADDFQWKSNDIKYVSYDLYLRDMGEDGICWENVALLNMFNIHRSLNHSTGTIYYRIYNPHFNRSIIVGEIAPSDEERITIHHDEWANSHRVVFEPVIGHDGNVVSARFAPNLRTGSCDGSGGSRNMYRLEKERPFAVFAQIGDTLRYLVAPNEKNLALHADSLKVTEATTSVTTDFRKATLCYFYITDTNGNLCPTEGGLGSVYYPQQPITIDDDFSSAGNYGYGFFNVGGYYDLTAPDGTRAAYVLPGTQTFQFGNPIVKTTDPDFLMPYNAQGRYILKQVTIPASTEPVSFSLGKSTPKRLVTTLTDAAPYAEHLNLEAISYVSRPYAWNDNVRIDIESHEIERQVKGNDLIITTLIEGSTQKIAAKLSANYRAQSDTIALGINAMADLNNKDFPPQKVGDEYRITQEYFELDSLKYTRLNFSTLHPVKFVLPCHLMQEGYKFHLKSSVLAHHEGCAKPLAIGSELPIPYDTITVILPENEKDYQYHYNWYMQKGKVMPDQAHQYKFHLDATGPAEQRIPDNQFSLLRVTNLGVDSIYVFNDVPEYKFFTFDKAISNQENNTKQLYRAEEAIYLHAGYNEHTIQYRQIKIEKDTFNAVTYWLDMPFSYKDAEGNYHRSYTEYNLADNHGTLDRMNTNTPDKAINLSTRCRMNLALTHSNWSAYLIEIEPSEADTTISFYNNRCVTTRFTFNGEKMPYFEWLKMCYNNQRIYVAPNFYTFYDRIGRMSLLPGHYTMEGAASVENAETGEYDIVPFNIAFDVPHAGAVELNPSIIESINTIPTNDNEAPQVQARYTIDGRRISAPQPGINIIKMTDGSVHKVMVK